MDYIDGSVMPAIGFYRNRDQTLESIDPDLLLGFEEYDGYAPVANATDDHGVSVTMFEKNGVFGAVFGLVGSGGHQVRAARVGPSLALVDLMDPDGEVGYRLFVEVDDPHVYPEFMGDDKGTRADFEDFHLGGIAQEIVVYPDEDTWQAAERARTEEEWQAGLAAARENGQPVDESEGPGAGLAPTFLASPWVLAVANGDAQWEDVNHITRINAIVDSVETVTNGFSGQPWLRVNANCGFPLCIGMPPDTTPAPQPGSILEGHVYLTGSSGFWQDVDEEYVEEEEDVDGAEVGPTESAT